MRTLLVVLAIGGVAFAALLLLVWWGQERVVFQPPAVAITDVPGAQRLDFASDDGTPLFAYLVRSADTRGDTTPAGDASTLVIHFHGNAEIAAWAIPWAHEAARRTGTDILLAEYRGYAGSPGTPTYDASRLDALALWRVAQAELGADAGRTIVHGFSLGSAVATELAQAIHPRALVLEAPFTSARDMAARSGPMLRGPLWGLIARVHYDTRAAVASLDTPVWVAHGESDRIIPPQMGRSVFGAARRKGEFLSGDGAGHNDLRNAPGYWRWLERALSAP